MLDAAAALFLVISASSPVDRDLDGINDVLETRLIEQFRPRFLLDSSECDGLPAELTAGVDSPEVMSRNGTIYTRASPAASSAPGTHRFELHYYHLWGRDCGPLSPHALDVEHVSALVECTSLALPDGCQALFWYAAAHEHTVCDTSNAARASVVAAERNGPFIWISAGKHASYLSPDLCRQRGCGVDRCDAAVPLERGALVNLGEAGQPLAGALWTASDEWALREKLTNDFDPELLATIESAQPAVLARIHGQWRATHFSLSVGGDIVGGLALSGKHSGAGLMEAGEHSVRALGKVFRVLGSVLGLPREP